MRVVSWNLGAKALSDRHREALRLLLDETGLGADIALVQECILPDELGQSHHVLWTRAWPNSAGHRWGTGLVVNRKYDFVPMEVRVPDTRFVVAEVHGPDFRGHVASIHAFTTMRGDWFSDGKTLRVVDRLKTTFEALLATCTGRFIVGGDLNTARSAHTTWPRYGHDEFWAWLDDSGFRPSPWSQRGEEVVTYRHPSGPFAGQADHILVDRDTASEARVTTHVSELGSDLSDHLPLVVDISFASAADDGGPLA